MSAEPVSHPHDLRAGVPDRLPSEVVRALSRIEPARALTALAVEWAAIAAIVLANEALGRWPLYLVAIVLIGGRQAALTVIAHDASHGRLLRTRAWNDAIGALLAAWPTFITLPAFRALHGDHHQHLAGTGDGNRIIWRTHRADGSVHPDWVYPKSVGGLLAKLALKAAGPTGLVWIVRGTLAQAVYRGSWPEFLGRVVFTLGGAALLTATGTWTLFLLYWILPFCTTHMVAQYVRLIAEHSAVPGEGPYALTRTTLAKPWEKLLFVPRNIHYHVEHHFYPSVPFYNLPALHEALMSQKGFRENAVVTPSLAASIRQVLA